MMSTVINPEMVVAATVNAIFAEVRKRLAGLMLWYLRDMIFFDINISVYAESGLKLNKNRENLTKWKKIFPNKNF